VLLRDQGGSCGSALFETEWAERARFRDAFGLTRTGGGRTPRDFHMRTKIEQQYEATCAGHLRTAR